MDLAKTVLSELWQTLAEMSPYLLLGFAVAGVLSVAISPEKVERHLGGTGFLPVLKASLFGIPLPLCSCGVIPVAASLRRHGASRGATMSFLLSTPQTGVDSILVTYSLLGPIIAIFRPLAALITGLVGGSLVDIMDGSHHAPTADRSPCCTGECGASSGPGQPSAILRAIRYGFLVLPRDIGRPMIAGLMVAGVIGALVPPDFFVGMLGTGVVPILVMMGIGIPLYVCATASVPIAAALIIKGLSPGAALAFLIAGPATNAAAIATIWSVLGRRATITYLFTVGLTALGFGLLLDAWFSVQGIRAADVACHTDPSLLGHVSAVIMLLLLASSLLPRASRGHDPAPQVGKSGNAT